MVLLLHSEIWCKNLGIISYFVRSQNGISFHFISELRWNSHVTLPMVLHIDGTLVLQKSGHFLRIWAR